MGVVWFKETVMRKAYPAHLRLRVFLERDGSIHSVKYFTNGSSGAGT